MTKLLFGADPEAEAVYKKNGVLYALPPYVFRTELGVPASDDKKHPVFLQGDGWKAHEDGANWEFAVRATHDPLELFQTMQDGARTVSEQILSQFPDYCQPNLQFLPSIRWENERWKNMPEDFFMSTRFGCDPDEDVYNYEATPREEDASLHPWRYCGGHIHVSGSAKIAEEPLLAIECMVITAGLAATAFSDVPELERQRLYLYGRPGKFRIQRYGMNNPYGPEYALGIEYRTPSCRWAGNWEIAQQVLHWAEIGIKNLFETSLGQELHDELKEPALNAILSTDQDLAKELLSYVQTRL